MCGAALSAWTGVMKSIEPTTSVCTAVRCSMVGNGVMKSAELCPFGGGSWVVGRPESSTVLFYISCAATELTPSAVARDMQLCFSQATLHIWFTSNHACFE